MEETLGFVKGPSDSNVNPKHLEKETETRARVYLLGCAARTMSMVSTPTPMILTTACPASLFARLWMHSDCRVGVLQKPTISDTLVRLSDG